MNFRSTRLVFILAIFVGSNYCLADMPNAYHSEQMSSGAIATGMDSCTNSATKAGPKLGANVIRSYCSCVIDWQVVHTTENNQGFIPPVPTLASCMKNAKNKSYPLKNAYNSKKLSSDTIWQFINRCQSYVGERMKQNITVKLPSNMSLYQCSCLSDFFRDHLELANGEAPQQTNHYCSEWAYSRASKSKIK